MAVNTYIVLGNNSETLPTGTSCRRFKVMMGSYKPSMEKTQTRKRTITGRADTQLGSIVRVWALTVKVHAVSADASYGTLGELRAFFMKNATSGADNARLTFWEFNDANVHKVELTGALTEDNITPVVEGTEATFYVPLTLEKVD